MKAVAALPIYSTYLEGFCLLLGNEEVWGNFSKCTAHNVKFDRFPCTGAIRFCNET